MDVDEAVSQLVALSQMTVSEVLCETSVEVSEAAPTQPFLMTPPEQTVSRGRNLPPSLGGSYACWDYMAYTGPCSSSDASPRQARAMPVMCDEETQEPPRQIRRVEGLYPGFRVPAVRQRSGTTLSVLSGVTEGDRPVFVAPRPLSPRVMPTAPVASTGLISNMALSTYVSPLPTLSVAWSPVQHVFMAPRPLAPRVVCTSQDAISGVMSNAESPESTNPRPVLLEVASPDQSVVMAPRAPETVITSEAMGSPFGQIMNVSVSGSVSHLSDVHVVEREVQPHILLTVVCPAPAEEESVILSQHRLPRSVAALEMEAQMSALEDRLLRSEQLGSFEESERAFSPSDLSAGRGECDQDANSEHARSDLEGTQPVSENVGVEQVPMHLGFVEEGMRLITPVVIRQLCGDRPDVKPEVKPEPTDALAGDVLAVPNQLETAGSVLAQIPVGDVQPVTTGGVTEAAPAPHVQPGVGANVEDTHIKAEVSDQVPSAAQGGSRNDCIEVDTVSDDEVIWVDPRAVHVKQEPAQG